MLCHVCVARETVHNAFIDAGFLEYAKCVFTCFATVDDGR